MSLEMSFKQMPKHTRSILLVFCGMALAACDGDQGTGNSADGKQTVSSPPSEDRQYEFRSYKDIETLFKKLDYTPESWRGGSRAVPRLYLSNIPARYRRSTSKKFPVVTKKRVFFRVMAPLFLRANELVAADRNRVLVLQKALRGTGGLKPANRNRLDALISAYGLKSPVANGKLSDALRELLIRADIVPLSLALSQAAEESGWGTSRFADEGNALFGQWTYSGKGIKPKEQRASKGNYRIAAFDSPLKSAIAYTKNLNTHPAYAKFRALRAAERNKRKKPRGASLVDGLSSYSERGVHYLKTIRSIMRFNKLAAVDNAYLADGPDISLVPVGPGSE